MGDKDKDDKKRRSHKKADTKKAARLAEDWLEELFELMQVEITAEVTTSKDGIEVDLSGDDAQLFIESRAAGLTSLQTVLSQVLSADGPRCSVILDVDGYRQRRAEALGSLAGVIGDKALMTGKSVTVLGMGSFERRAVHHGLADNDQLETESSGYGPFRRLKITPT